MRADRPRASFWCPALALAALLLFAASPAAAMTPPGTSIDNVASADYVDSGVPVTVSSNVDSVVTVANNTASALELLHYAPGNPLANPFAVASAPCSASGGAGARSSRARTGHGAARRDATKGGSHHGGSELGFEDTRAGVDRAQVAVTSTFR